MADGSVPDIAMQLAQTQSMIAAAASNNGVRPAPIFAIFPGGRDKLDVTGGVTLMGKGFNSDGMICKLPQQGKPKLADKFLQAIASVHEDCKKAAQGVTAVYSGDLPNGTLPGAPAGGGSFVDSIGPRGGGGGGFTPDM